ncbi:PH domain-containing protein [Catenuloplanes japonicus]|uniref:PH domain-containing protein n=1 Tax=Catenuloplanes japonicus TaxID=33876 RepID=UPI00068E5E0A|nr:PH domain-containing protein [Catenuloplanes japonicus]
MTHADPPAPVVLRAFRPRVMRVAAVVIAALICWAIVVSGLNLTGTVTANGGQTFESDSWALIALGPLLALPLLLPLRVRVQADASGVHVQNLVREFDVPWSAVRAVRYRHGAPWATLDLVTNEIVTVLAVQALDGPRALEAIRALRKLHLDSQAG